MAFLKPTGPFEIGSINHSLLDTSRPSHLKNNGLGRRVTVKTWYPCNRIDGRKAERIWEEVRQNDRTPLPMKALLGVFATSHFNLAIHTNQLKSYHLFLSCIQPRPHFLPFGKHLLDGGVS